MQTAKLKKKAELMTIVPGAAKIVVGLDVGDRKSHYCRLDQEGHVSAEGSVLTKESALRAEFEAVERTRPRGDCGQRTQLADDRR
jgi:hypothetical protein